jgi:hypothetical protein
MFLIITIAIILFVVFFLKPYFVRHDSVILYTGGLGSGKTFLAVKSALKLLRKNRFKVWVNNHLKPWKEKLEIPQLYSTTPVKISKKEMSLQLKQEHILLTERQIPLSVTLIDEISLVRSQMDWKDVNDENIEEWCTLYRQYTLGGYLIMTTQNTSKCNYHFRYCVNSAFNLSKFRKFLCFYFVNVRNISLIDDIKSIADSHLEDSESRIFGISFGRKYDTYCFSNRTKTVPFGIPIRHKSLKTNKLPTLPKKIKFEKLTTSIDEEIEEQTSGGGAFARLTASLDKILRK